MSSNLCSCTAASTTLTGTLTGGIQDIAALLPLLGTEQCEDHVSSALTKGYLYAAASPMSLFGSLGLARAGLKTFLASFSIPEWDIVGARTLLNMGFKPLGMNLSVIMIDPNDKEGRYLIETRLDKLVEELHIDKTKIENVQHTSIRWNARMMTLSTILCMLSMVPYIFLNVKTSNSLPHNTRWTFPALRAAGGFLTTAMMQVIIQRRTTTLARRWISKHGTLYPRVPNRGFDPFQNMPYIVRKSLITLRGIGQIFRCSMTPRRFKNDVEMGLNVTATDSNSLFTWCLLALLLLGVLSSVVGYVGCFSVVQNASGSNALIWFCLESGLSLLRMFLWGLNPGFDNAPPLKLILARDRYPPLPTCKLYDHDIVTEKVLPLTRANQFLNSITSFTGVVDHFDHPDVTLYYTLTRSAVPHADSQNAAQLHEPGDHVLYITIFDHKERANTRVYMRRNGIDRFYATESNLPVIDLKQGLLEIKLGDEIDSHDDPITSDHDIRSQLNAHYRSIMDQIHFAMGQPTFLPRYKIENKWTMAMVHTTSTPQTEGEIEATRVYPDARVSLRDFLYLQHGRLENIRQSLSLARGEWIATYMHWGIQEMRGSFVFQASTRMVSDVDDTHLGEAKAEGKRRLIGDQATSTDLLQMETDHESKLEDLGLLVIDEIRRMELLLVKEMGIWEEHLRDQAKKFICRPDVSRRTRSSKEWERGFRTRVDTDIRAMEARLDAAGLEVKASRSDELTRQWQSADDDIHKAWRALAQRYVQKPSPSPPPTNLPHLDHLETEFQESARDIENMIGWSQLTAAQREQLQRQSEVASRSTSELKEAVFWMDNTGLTKYKVARSKWLDVDIRHVTQPLEAYTRALTEMNQVIFATFSHVDSDDDYAFVSELIRHLPPSVTSIHVTDSHHLPAIQRDAPLFVNDHDSSNKIETFLHDNQSQLALDRRTHIFIATGIYSIALPAKLKLSPGSKIAVSFYGPPSGNLTLKLTHSSDGAAETLVLKEPHGSRTFQYPVPSSLAVTTITLSSSPSDHPSFLPHARNNLIIEVTWRSVSWQDSDYVFQDIQLQDEAGNDCDAAAPDILRPRREATMHGWGSRAKTSSSGGA